MTFEKIDNFSEKIDNLMKTRIPQRLPMVWLIVAGYFDFIHFIRDRQDLFE